MKEENIQKDIISFEVDGNWIIDDVEKFSSALRYLYKLGLLIDYIHRSSRGQRSGSFWVDNFNKMYQVKDIAFLESLLKKYYYPSDELTFAQFEIVRVQYASPGVVDLVGLGAVVGHIKELAIKTIEFGTTRRQRELENEQREEEIRKLKLENAFEYVKLLKECGYEKDEIKSLVSLIGEKQNVLFELVLEGKITNVETSTYSRFKKKT
jgi:hypothetical protein